MLGKEKIIPSDKIIKTLLFNYNFLDLSKKQLTEKQIKVFVSLKSATEVFY